MIHDILIGLGGLVVGAVVGAKYTSTVSADIALIKADLAALKAKVLAKL